MSKNIVRSQYRERVRVLCRVRPAESGAESEHSNLIHHDILRLHNNAIEIVDKDSSDVYSFDKVFDMQVNQLAVADYLGEPILTDVLSGINVSVVMYGPPNSGKSYTLLGPDVSDPIQRGLIPRTVELLFAKLSLLPKGITYSCKISFVDIYLERINDLLDTSKLNLKTREEKNRGVYVEGVTEENVSCSDDVIELIKKAQQNYLPFTKNNSPKRSHLITTIFLYQNDNEKKISTYSKLLFANIANYDNTTIKHNKSYVTFNDVITSLSDESTRPIRYRDSKLTKMLKDSFGGNSKTILFITCSNCLGPTAPLVQNNNASTDNLSGGSNSNDANTHNLYPSASTASSARIAELKTLLGFGARAGTILNKVHINLIENVDYEFEECPMLNDAPHAFSNASASTIASRNQQLLLQQRKSVGTISLTRTTKLPTRKQSSFSASFHAAATASPFHTPNTLPDNNNSYKMSVLQNNFESDRTSYSRVTAATSSDAVTVPLSNVSPGCVEDVRAAVASVLTSVVSIVEFNFHIEYCKTGGGDILNAADAQLFQGVPGIVLLGNSNVPVTNITNNATAYQATNSNGVNNFKGFIHLQDLFRNNHHRMSESGTSRVEQAHVGAGLVGDGVVPNGPFTSLMIPGKEGEGGGGGRVVVPLSIVGGIWLEGCSGWRWTSSWVKFHDVDSQRRTPVPTPCRPSQRPAISPDLQ